jgi:Toprim-like
LQRVGILRDSGHEHFNGSIVVPLFGAAHGSPADDGLAGGVVVGGYGRKVSDNLRAGTPKHLCLPGPHRGVFNREGIEGQQESVVCEALIDALTFWSAGYRNVTSCYGVNGFTDELLAAFKACGAQRVLIAFDRGEAGDRAAEVLAKRLMAEGLDCFRLLFPKGMDANAYACAVKPPERSLGVVIRLAEWLGAGVKPALTTRCFKRRVPRLLLRPRCGACSLNPILVVRCYAGRPAEVLQQVLRLRPASALVQQLTGSADRSHLFCDGGGDKLVQRDSVLFRQHRCRLLD